jgi:hypothetical protein
MYLGKWGFSYQEAARLSPSSWLDLCIGEKNVTEIDEGSTTLFTLNLEAPLSTEEEQKIYARFLKNLSAKQRWRAISLFYLLSGTQETDCVYREFEQNQIQCMTTLFQAQEFSRIFESKIRPVNAIKLNLPFFEPFLKKAAYLTAALRSLLETKPAKTGNILPAIYHSLVVPLATKNITRLEPDEEKKLIKQIALCALRENTEFPPTVALFDPDVESLMQKLGI